MEDKPVYQKKKQEGKSKLVMSESWAVVDLVGGSRVIHNTDSMDKAIHYIKNEINSSGIYVPLPVYTYEYFD